MSISLQGIKLCPLKQSAWLAQRRQDTALSDGGAGIACKNVRQKATGALSVGFFSAGFNELGPVSRTCIMDSFSSFGCWVYKVDV